MRSRQSLGSGLGWAVLNWAGSVTEAQLGTTKPQQRGGRSFLRTRDAQAQQRGAVVRTRMKTHAAGSSLLRKRTAAQLRSSFLDFRLLLRELLLLPL